ncbi:serine/threonine-protein kinase [Micromonospora cathayae]|uniref:non-specific serine/threonine protein kinase n=1 Tax=Micromonospora cathayae TaxID=3028804 RepID=A0ABY7ZK87_9ACTN|nr:serine/threonine-protein kinase [Micromonospora sp. HUAS 3]WDZ83376.1 protein kinase [Micromonospora sp. HUAS 3]
MTEEPRRVGRYRLVRCIGQGGMGRVWLARDDLLERDVAVKEVALQADPTGAEAGRQGRRTLREAQAAARFDHPNVVPVYDVVTAQGRPWIVMQYVPSRSLHRVVTDDGPLDPPTVARIGLEIVEALRAAHRAGVLHRDVTPRNVLITADGRALLGDFGVASIEGVAAMSQSWGITASPQYVAPERVRHGESTPATDLWALGATLYAAVEGRPPYTRPGTVATLLALATEPPDPMRRAGPLAPVIAALLHRDTRRRTTADEAARSLRKIAGPTAARSRPVPDPATGPDGADDATRPVPGPDGVTRALPGPAEATQPLGDLSQVTQPLADPAAATEPPADLGQVTEPLGDLTQATQPLGGRGGYAQRAAGGPAPAPADDVTSAPARTAIREMLAGRSSDASTGDRPARRTALTFAAAVLALGAVAAATTFGVRATLGGLRNAAGGTGGGATASGAAPAPAPVPTRPPAPTVTPPPPAAPCLAPPGPDAERPAEAVTAAPDGPYALPRGWLWHADATGFTVGLPGEWLRFRDGEVVCLRDPRLDRVLAVEVGREPVPDPVRHWTDEAERLVDVGALPGYRKISIGPLIRSGGAAEWEYTWDPPDGERQHALRTLANRGRSGGYELTWVASDVEWSTDTAFYRLVSASFRPAG